MTDTTSTVGTTRTPSGREIVYEAEHLPASYFNPERVILRADFGDEGEFEVRVYGDRGDGHRGGGVNWSACGTMDPDVAEAYAALILAGATLAPTLKGCTP